MWNCYPNLKNDDDCVLSKYTDEGIIQPARLNPGFGLLRMLPKLYSLHKKVNKSSIEIGIPTISY